MKSSRSWLATTSMRDRIRTSRSRRFQAHDNQTISETIDLTFDSLTNTATTFVLRARAGGGDRMLNGIVDCVDCQSFAQQIARGCKSTFQIHPQSPCSRRSAAPPDCIHGTGTPGLAPRPRRTTTSGLRTATAPIWRTRTTGRATRYPTRRPAPDHRPRYTDRSSVQLELGPSGDRLRRVLRDRLARHALQAVATNCFQPRRQKRPQTSAVRSGDTSSASSSRQASAPPRTRVHRQRPVRPDLDRHRSMHRNPGPVDRVDPERNSA